ncbi:ATP-binding protein [Thermodesulfobium sp.]
MNAFHSIAVPHKDILEGRLRMDIFAADLWDAYHNRGSVEYKDASTFFQKTYITQGLHNLVGIIQNRINGKGGDPTIQIQTPFGGGKTHSLIALMHKAREWGATPIVIVGTESSSKDTLWGIIETQLTGKNEYLTGLTSPGKDKLKSLLSRHQPFVILIDELLEYIVKAAGERVGESTLAAQTVAFLQELSETISTLEKSCLVLTLPSSLMEHYDQTTEKLYSQIQRVVGRVEKIYTPVSETEISKVIRQRLFSSIDLQKVKSVVNDFMVYAQKESILPIGTEPTEYRDRFIDSYPFLPEVLDVLYHRWGSFPNFQRTRGVLRLLSLVISILKDQSIPYITLADFNLANGEIRQELLKHIGTEYNSIIAQDITDSDAGSKKVDINLGDSYKGLKLATRTATTIFMYSFSGGTEKGATLNEIKRSATTLDNPSSVVAEAIEQLKNKLFYFQFQNDKYFFSNQPNLNRIILTKTENIKEEDVSKLEYQLLKESVTGGDFKVYIWQEDPSSIPDTEEFKLVILQNENKDVIESIIKSKGTSVRVNCNTIFLLFPSENERIGFKNRLKRYLAYKSIEKDTTINLSEIQLKEIKSEIKKIEPELKESIRRFYRYIAVPTKDSYKKIDLGIPTYGDQKSLVNEIYDRLRSENEILENMVPIVIKEKYLSNKDYVHTKKLLDTFYRIPGEPRIKDKYTLQKAISDGVLKGIFGLGELDADIPRCIYIKEKPEIGFSDNEIIIKENLCVKKHEEDKRPQVIIKVEENVIKETSPSKSFDTQAIAETKELNEYETVEKNINLSFKIPKGKVSDIFRIVNLIQTQFESVYIDIKATDGSMSKQDYQNKIIEALQQLNIEIDK